MYSEEDYNEQAERAYAAEERRVRDEISAESSVELFTRPRRDDDAFEMRSEPLEGASAGWLGAVSIRRMAQ
jgi:hypothetical protein